MAKYQKAKYTGGIYTPWASIPLDSSITAVTENLVVNFLNPVTPSSLSQPQPSTSSSSSGTISKRRSLAHSDSCCPVGASRALIGVSHLDTFLIHEVSTDPSKDFGTKHIQSVQLPAALQNRCFILRARWISIGKPVPTKLLILCTNLATFFFDEMGTKQLFKYEYDSGDGDLSRCCQTIAVTKSHILMGNNRGELHFFTYDSRRGSIHPWRTAKLISEPISEMCARRNGLLAVGAPSGSLSIWIIGEGETRKCTEYLLPEPEPVTSIVLWYPYAIVSYGSGVLRMYSLFQRTLVAVVNAHSRWISCIDLCPSSGLLLSLAEDDEAKVWCLRRRQNDEHKSPIKLQSTIQMDDVNFIGGKFLNVSGTSLGLCNLGNKDVALYAVEECIKR